MAVASHAADSDPAVPWIGDVEDTATYAADSRNRKTAAYDAADAVVVAANAGMAVDRPVLRVRSSYSRKCPESASSSREASSPSGSAETASWDLAGSCHPQRRDVLEETLGGC